MTKEEFERSLLEDDQRFYFYIYEDFNKMQHEKLDKRGIYKSYGDRYGKGGETTFFYTDPNSDMRMQELELDNVFKNKIGLKPKIDLILIKNRKRLIDAEKQKKEDFLKEIKKMEKMNK